MDHFDHNPNPLVDAIVPALLSYSIVNATQLGIFDRVAAGACTVQEIAAACSLDPVGTERIASLLVASGYLRRSDGRYSLTEVSIETLGPGGRVPLDQWVRFSRMQLRVVEQLDTRLSGGGPIDLIPPTADEDARILHQRAMAQTAAPIAPWVARSVPVPDGAHLMIDIGGSHGLYSAELCRLHPPMRSLVFELPGMAKSAHQVAEEYKTNRYCTYTTESLAESRLKDSVDVALLSNVVHHYNEADLETLFRDVHDALCPGGTIAVWDISPEPRSENLVSASFSLFFFLTSGSQCYGKEHLLRALATVGFEETRSAQPSADATHTLTLGRKRE